MENPRYRKGNVRKWVGSYSHRMVGMEASGFKLLTLGNIPSLAVSMGNQALSLLPHLRYTKSGSHCLL